jgi:uncharacterized protein
MSTNDLIGKGFPFPFKPNAHHQLKWSSGPARLQDAIWILLSTCPGERVMRPTYGAGAPNQLFQPNSAIGRAALAQSISQALVQWEPRISVVQVTVDPSPDVDSQVLATITYSIRATNELFNMVYPLYLSEGAT